MDGFAFALLAAIIWGIGPIFAKLGVTSAKISGADAVVVRFTGALIFFSIFMLISGKVMNWSGIMTLPKKTVLLLFTEGILGAFLGQFAYYQAQRLWEASKVTAIAATFPLVTFVLALIFLNESFNWYKGGGIMLIVAGALLLRMS